MEWAERNFQLEGDPNKLKSGSLPLWCNAAFTFNFIILFRSGSISIKCYMLRHDRYRLWIVVACCALYPGEIFNLRWDPINFHNIAEMKKTKTKQNTKQDKKKAAFKKKTPNKNNFTTDLRT